MSRDKQIEEIYNDLCDAPTGSVNSDFTIGTLQESHTNLFIRILAGHLYSKGYRKVDSATFMGGIVEQLRAEVAEEIFAEIDMLIVRRMIADSPFIDDRLIRDIAKLKKKYTESEKNNGN